MGNGRTGRQVRREICGGRMIPFWKSLKFWEAATYVVAALVAYFTSYQLEAGVLLLLVLTVLRLIGIVPELRAKGLL